MLNYTSETLTIFLKLILKITEIKFNKTAIHYPDNATSTVFVVESISATYFFYQNVKNLVNEDESLNDTSSKLHIKKGVKEQVS